MFELMAATDLPGLFCSECSQETLYLMQTVSVVETLPELRETAPVSHPGQNRFWDQAINHVTEKTTWMIQCRTCYSEWEFKKQPASSRARR